MYCVQCGVFLTNENQEGLVCHCCKQARGESRRMRGLAVCVQYCFSCGQSYQPADASILHVTCFAGGMNKRAICSLFTRMPVCSQSVLSGE